MGIVLSTGWRGDRDRRLFIVHYISGGLINIYQKGIKKEKNPEISDILEHTIYRIIYTALTLLVL